ncbi:MAG: PAS domain-containing protein, partial [Actinomycetes bacterium]
PSVTADVLFPQRWERWTAEGSGQMALGSALALLSLGGAVLAGRRDRIASVCGAVGFLLAYVAVLGHLYGVTSFHSLQSATAMTLPTALALAALGLCVLLQPRRPLTRLVTSRGSAGSLARRLLPWGLAGPPVSGWVVQQGQALGWYGTRFSMSLLVLACVVSTVLVAFVGARSAARIDRARERAVDELESLNAVLSERVAVAVAESEESRDRMRFLLDSTPVGIFETGPDGVVRYVNQRWMELAGVDGAKDHDWQSVLHPADRERVVRDWQAAIAAAREYSTRYRSLRPDGGVTWVEVTARAVTAADGSVTRWLGSVTDVTGQVQAQELLAESERRYRSVVTTMAEGVVLQ